MATAPLARLRSICLRLPEAHEVEAWGEPTFRVRKKMFAMYASADTHHGAGCPAVWCKSTLFDQDQLVRAHPRRFFVPPYVGPQGWVGIRLNGRPNWTMIAELLGAAYRLAAPKRLLR
jgi:hypothetical protein